jgi:hypothetical protein
MKPGRLVAGGLAVLALVTGWLLLGSTGERLAIDLVDELAGAKQVPGDYDVVDLELAGQTRRAITIRDFGRTIWTVTVPDDAWLRVSIGQETAAWTTEGDGVIFMIGVSDQVQYDDLLTFVVNPFHNPADRVWHDLVLDLSHYAGQSVDLIFNVRSRANELGDLPAWGAPRIVTR